MEISDCSNSFCAQFSVQAINHPQQAGSPLWKFATRFVMDEYCLALLHLFMFHVCARSLVDWSFVSPPDEIFHHTRQLRGETRMRGAPENPLLFCFMLCQKYCRGRACHHRAVFVHQNQTHIAVGATFHVAGWNKLVFMCFGNVVFWGNFIEFLNFPPK